jgi:tRNA-dihydrouridine synthase C
VPIIANGDIWTFEDFLRCREETGCRHFMIGRGALANPALPHQIARELGIGASSEFDSDWVELFGNLVELMADHPAKSLTRLKQWMKIANAYGTFPHFHELKAIATLTEFFEMLSDLASAERKHAVGVGA